MDGLMEGMKPGMAMANRCSIFVRTMDEKTLRADRAIVGGLQKDGAGFLAIKTKMIGEMRADDEWLLGGPFT